MRVDPITTGSSATAGKLQLGISQAQPTCKSTTTGTNPSDQSREKGGYFTSFTGLGDAPELFYRGWDRHNSTTAVLCRVLETQSLSVGSSRLFPPQQHGDGCQVCSGGSEEVQGRAASPYSRDSEQRIQVSPSQGRSLHGSDPDAWHRAHPEVLQQLADSRLWRFPRKSFQASTG